MHYYYPWEPAEGDKVGEKPGDLVCLTVRAGGYAGSIGNRRNGTKIVGLTERECLPACVWSWNIHEVTIYTSNVPFFVALGML
jgi:hypothetical protein